MAQIRDELILLDSFSNPLRKYVDSMGRAGKAARTAQKEMTSGWESLAGAARISARNMSATADLSAQQQLNTYRSMLSGIQKEMARLDVVNESRARRADAMAAAGRQESDSFRELDTAMERSGIKYRELAGQKDILRAKIEETAAAYQREQAAAQQAAQAQAAAAQRAAQVQAAAETQAAVQQAQASANAVGASAQGAANAMRMYAQAVAQSKAETERNRLALRMESQALQEVISKYGACSNEARAQAQAVSNAADAVSRSEMRTRAYSAALAQEAGGAKQAARAVREYSDTANRAASSTNILMTKVGGLVGAFMGLRGIKALVGLSDNMVQTKARLNIVNDGSMSTDALQKMIYESAQRSRGDYMGTADMVSKMGIMAGDAFHNDPRELVAFTETLNKMYTVSGTNQAGRQAATLQLEQAMAMGVLRGQEFRSVVQQVPMLVQAVADSLGVSTGEVKKMADEGLITASVVKNAMFRAADDVNAKFETMPMTWGQVWTSMKNEAIMAAQPLLDVVNEIAQHWDSLKPIFLGVASAIGVVAVAWGVYTVAQNLANAAMWTNPLFWIALAVGVAVIAIYQFIQSCGGLKLAWMTAVDFVKTWGDKLKIFFWSFVYGVQDAVGDLKAGVLTNLESMLNSSIDLINDFVSLLNQIPGVAIKPIDHLTFGAEDALKNEAAKQNRAAALVQMQNRADMEHRWRQMTINGTRELSLAAQDNGLDISGMAQDVNAIAGDTKKLTANMADEDLKYMEDVAIRRYETHVNSTSLVPQITVQVNGSADRGTADDIAGRIAAILRREASSQTSISYAEV